jgi:hypothetical protein
MDDNQRTMKQVGAILAGLSWIAGAVYSTGAMIATAVNKEAASGEITSAKWLGIAFLVFGVIVLIGALGRRRS